MLTANQLYLAQLVAFGFNDKAIADKMGSTAGTVKRVSGPAENDATSSRHCDEPSCAVVSGLHGCDR
jgi:hypothetical protein